MMNCNLQIIKWMNLTQSLTRTLHLPIYHQVFHWIFNHFRFFLSIAFHFVVFVLKNWCPHFHKGLQHLFNHILLLYWLCKWKLDLLHFECKHSLNNYLILASILIRRLLFILWNVASIIILSRGILFLRSLFALGDKRLRGTAHWVLSRVTLTCLSSRSLVALRLIKEWIFGASLLLCNLFVLSDHIAIESLMILLLIRPVAVSEINLISFLG